MLKKKSGHNVDIKELFHDIDSKYFDKNLQNYA